MSAGRREALDRCAPDLLDDALAAGRLVRRAKHAVADLHN
jgi:hypothetical protein